MDFNRPRSSDVADRDILRFVKLRVAHESDDLALGDLLTRAFTATYEKKLPTVPTPYARLSELRDVAGRRGAGLVFVLELGYRPIGTVSIVRPGAPGTQAWGGDAANVRCVAIDPEFHGLGLSDRLLEAAEGAAAAWGARFACLHVQIGARGLVRLYEGRGYRRAPAGDAALDPEKYEAFARELAPGLDARLQA